MRSTAHRLVLATFILLFGLRCFGQPSYQHSSNCWLENHSGYGISFSGTNPTLSEIHDEIRRLSLEHNVPIEIIAAVCYRESGLYQYGSDGFVIHNKPECIYCNDHGVINVYGTPPPPGLGIMQFTGPTALGLGTANVPRLITDWQFNLEEGVKLLARYYLESGLGPAPAWMPPLAKEHALVLENWFYAIRRFNGYKTQTGYPNEYLDYVRIIYGIISSLPADGRLNGLFTPVTIAEPASVITNWTDGAGYVALSSGTWFDKNQVFYTGVVHESPSTTIRAISKSESTPVPGATATFGGVPLQPADSGGYFKVPAWLSGTKILRVLRGNLLFDELFSCPAPSLAMSPNAAAPVAATSAEEADPNELTVELTSTLSAPTGPTSTSRLLKNAPSAS